MLLNVLMVVLSGVRLVPSVSAKQERFMQAVANNPKFAKKVGVPTSVGKEFTKSGGGMAESKKMVGKEIAFMKKKGAPKSMMKHEMNEMKGMKKGGMMKKMADGGKTSSKSVEERVAKKSLAPYELKAQKFEKSMRGGGGRRVSGEMQLGADLDPKAMMRRMNEDFEGSYKKGGMMKKMAGGGMPMVMKDGVKVPAFAADGKGKMKHGGMAMKKMASGGLAAGHKSADGVVSKGKTKGKMMAKGGMAMKKGGYC